jgi:hypothetical protein
VSLLLWHEAHLLNGLAAAAKRNGVALMAIGLDANCFAEAKGYGIDMHHQPADFAAGSRGDRHGRKGAEHPPQRPPPERLQGLRQQPGLIFAAAWVGGSVVGVLRLFHGDLSGALRDSFWCGWMEGDAWIVGRSGRADGVTTCRRDSC